MEERRLPRVIALTGLDTFVAERLVPRLLSSDPPPRLVGLDRQLPRRLEGRVRFHEVDLTEPTADSAVAEILEKEAVEALVHAAFFERAVADRPYAHELEVIGSLHVMNAAAAAGLRKLVVASSGQVYGASPENPNFLSEDAPLRGHPDAPDVRDRAEMEGLLQLFADRHSGMVVTSLRPCFVIGPTVETRAVRHFEGRRVITALGFDPLLQFLHEGDYVRAFEHALRRDARGPFNLAGPGAMPLSMLLRLAGKKPVPLPHPLLYRAAYLPSLWSAGATPAGFYDYLRFLWVLDTERAADALDFVPEYTTREAWMSFVVSRRLRSYR